MIKKTLKYPIVLALLIVLSCNQDDANTPTNYPKDGLVAYFPFDGNWEEVITPNTIVAVSENDPIFDNDRNGNPNSSIYFEGFTQYLNITLAANIISSQNNQASIAFWLKNDITAGLSRTLLAEDNLQAIGIHTNSELPSKISINYNYLVEENEDGTTAQGLNVVHPSEVGVWTHLVYTVDSNDLKIFINGSLVGEVLGDLTPILQPYMQFILGANADKNEFWRGNLDELFFYDRTLTNEEINILYLR